ncbi:MAG: hypothetical protein JSS02_21650 [Planctomycetes bacterium]|nr:hypothetical protein [Planctomycetota bacterium]
MSCPGCQAKVIVPEPTQATPPAPPPPPAAPAPVVSPPVLAETVVAAAPPEFTRQGPEGHSESLPATPAGEFGAHDFSVHPASVGRDDDEWEHFTGISAKRSSRRPARNYFGWLIPFSCIGLLFAVGWVLLQKPPEKLEGRLVGERLTDTEFESSRVDSRRFGRTKAEVQTILETLEIAPVRANTPTLNLEFRAANNSMEIAVHTTGRSEFFRVDPAKDKKLAAFIDDHKQDYRAAVDQGLQQAVPKFLAELEPRAEKSREIEGLAEYRDAVGLASLMKGTGFGYFVQASIGKQGYPCIHEDTQGRLYFALPEGTREFELVAHSRAPRSPQHRLHFAGRYTVRISENPITLKKEPEDGNEKVRRALKKAPAEE